MKEVVKKRNKSRSLRDDKQKGNGKGKGNRRSLGMTNKRTSNSKATATAKACGWVAVYICALCGAAVAKTGEGLGVLRLEGTMAGG